MKDSLFANIEDKQELKPTPKQFDDILVNRQRPKSPGDELVIDPEVKSTFEAKGIHATTKEPNIHPV